jgi:hypothetical protein
VGVNLWFKCEMREREKKKNKESRKKGKERRLEKKKG